MNTQIFFSLKFILLSFVLFELTTAVPQWHNSTDGRQYLIEGELKYNWFQANHECARKNMQLVEIHSQEKNEALVRIFKSIFGKSHNLWLGANDEYNSNNNLQRPFYWSTSGKPITFSYWADNTPDNFENNEHCVHITVYAPDFRWNDIPCDSPDFGFVCEEHYLQEVSRKSVGEMQKTLSQTMTKLSRDFHEQQKQQIEKLENAQKDIVKEDNDLKEVLDNIETKLEYDIAHALAQLQREIKSVVEDSNKKIRALNVEIRNYAEVMSKKFTDGLESVQNMVN